MSSKYGGAREAEAPAAIGEDAKRWLQQRQDLEARGGERAAKREHVLRTSLTYGLIAGSGGVGAGAYALYRAGPAFGGGNPALASFSVFVSFFMPFMFVSNLTRGRSQGAKTALWTPRGAAATDTPGGKES